MTKILLISFVCIVEGYLNDRLLSPSIARHHKGDVYTAQGEKCFEDGCVGLPRSGEQPNNASECQCKCSSSRPVFRDDLSICVDDMEECPLLPFASGASLKKIPYVFLPLKGQIVYPSAEIVISGLETPICVVSGGQFLGRNGWSDLRNNTGTEPPFRLFRDEGKTYLQWLGETSLRMAMEGRIILVHLMCKDAEVTEESKILTPCIAFRVAGNTSMREVMFASDMHLKEEYNRSLSLREYVAIGICSLLLAFVYVASVFLYLQWRRKKGKRSKKSEEDAQLTLGEEGVVKSNPLLQAGGNLIEAGEDNPGYISDSNSCSSDVEQSSDLLCLDEEDFGLHENVQTSVIIHPCNSNCGETSLIQDSNNIEKLPEENVSIVETLEVKDEHSETAKVMGSSNGRRKLYFNPAYFEPDLLKAPPPAALEFLVKIREVIAIAKHKMSAKKFAPSLFGIPEEEGSTKGGKSIIDGSTITQNKKNREENKQSQTNRVKDHSMKPFFVSKEFFCPMDVKQKIIRKWLEDIPTMGHPDDIIRDQESLKQNPTKSRNMSILKGRDGTPPIPEMNFNKPDRKRHSTKGKAPLPPKNSFNEKKKEDAGLTEKAIPPQPPPLPCFDQTFSELPRAQVKDRSIPIPAKNLMDAVIQELTAYKKSDNFFKAEEYIKGNPKIVSKNDCAEEETKIFEQNSESKKVGSGMSNGVDENSKRKEAKKEPQDDHDYEVILLASNPNSLCEEKQAAKDLKIYNLPEILSKNDRSEGYSLVSEVYVNDGYSCCSGESSPSSLLSVESDKNQVPILEETPGRLTIYVNDIPGQYKVQDEETDNFEPDTLDRKPQKIKSKKKVRGQYTEKSSQSEENTRQSNEGMSIENFADSLERPSIMLKTTGSFNQNSVEKNIDDLFRNFTWRKAENFGSLREIYEAKNKNYKRSETASLTDLAHGDADCMSTLSWSEERKNKLLHRGIVLHIEEEKTRRHKSRSETGRSKVRSPADGFLEGTPERPPKPDQSFRSRSQSPRSNQTLLTLSPKPKCFSPSIAFPQSPSSSRTVSPPLPPPRTVPNKKTFFPHPKQPTNFFSDETEVFGRDSPKDLPPLHSTIKKNSKTMLDGLPHSKSPFSYTQEATFGSSSKTLQETMDNPPLPPRNTKPPLPPKGSKRVSQKPPASKLASRPLPPLPVPCPTNHFPSSLLHSKDVETLSLKSGASTDSLNFSDYETFYTLPYEGNERENSGKETLEALNRKPNPDVSFSSFPESIIQLPSKKWQDTEEKSWRFPRGSFVQGVEDFGYLSTDSGDSSCPTRNIMSSSFSTNLEKEGPGGDQNSETEESVCDGASESGAESTTTDSFFYGGFHKGKEEKLLGSNVPSEVYPFPLRLSDVEVNSDTERHCVPIMVRP